MKKKILAMMLALIIFSSMICGCIDYENMFSPVLPVAPTPAPTYTIPPIPVIAPAPSMTESEKNIEIVTDIVEEYYKTHTYSKYDLFVCGDMAIDVWNMVETQGINAEIAVGNINDPDARWTEYNHVWVLAEVSPDGWLALEPTGGYTTHDDNYYTGYFFENPNEFKEYLALIREYNAQISKIEKLQTEYSNAYYEVEREIDYYSMLVDNYNDICAGRSLPPEDYQNCLTLHEELNNQRIIVERAIGKAEQLYQILEEEIEREREIVEEIYALVS
ncbi:MAG TPA: hypothetical protein PLU40_05985 [Methanoculleus sp.]|jgi:hypothetical protein|nr:hypothetical protein [Methanoculleus sp.]